MYKAIYRGPMTPFVIGRDPLSGGVFFAQIEHVGTKLGE